MAVAAVMARARPWIRLRVKCNHELLCLSRCVIDHMLEAAEFVAGAAEDVAVIQQT